MFKKHFFGYFIMACLGFLTNSQADEPVSPWSISGFGSFSVIGTDTDEIGFYRDRTQTQDVTSSAGVTVDSRLGLQVDYKINQQFQLMAQWVARDHAGDFFEQNLEWAFLRWSPQADTHIRAGRLGVDVYLLADYRNVGYTYPWMRPPHEFYAGIPLYHFDGVDMSQHYNVGEGSLTLKVFGGYSANVFTTNPNNEAYAMDIPLVGGNLLYESMNWRAKLSYSYLYLLDDSPGFEEASTLLNQPLLNQLLPNIRETIPYLTIKEATMHFASIGGGFDDGVWLTQAEVSYLSSSTPLVPSQASAYWSFGRRFSNVTLYTLLGIAQSFQNDVYVPEPVVPLDELQAIHDGVDNTLNYNGVDQRSISVGLRWDVYSNIALKAQWGHFWLGENGSQLWQKTDSSQPPETVNVWSIGFDFIF